MKLCTTILLPYDLIAAFIAEKEAARPDYLTDQAIFVPIRDYIQETAYDDEGFGGAFNITGLRMDAKGWEVDVDIWVDAADVLSYMRMYVEDRKVAGYARPPSLSAVAWDIGETFASYLGGKQMHGRQRQFPLVAKSQLSDSTTAA